MAEIAKGAYSPAEPCTAAVHIVKARKKVPMNSAVNFEFKLALLMNLDQCEREINIALVLTFWTIECGAVRLDDPPYLSFTTRFSALLALPSIYAKMMWEVSQ